jgi:radical SAM superfamily enzyme YgiQ (UPF0313 family)
MLATAGQASTRRIAVANIVLINPRFETSYWGIEHALPIFRKRANMPVGCLPLLAALTPPEHTVTLVDECVEPLDFDRIAKADIVGVTGMIVQRARMREILVELKKRGAFVVVGGPWVTVNETYFGDLADVIFVGEAEETWPQFLQDWKRGDFQGRYEQADRTDMAKVPTPRLDLLRNERYMFGCLQFSRGCPFQCEFCDIIVTFGRRPRVKTKEQVLAELDALYATGMREVFVVDDNLIGNKRVVKELLRAVVAWQEAHDYALSLFTEASLDLSEDQELLRLMIDANFLAVFVGVESPNEDALRETKKLQNVRKGASILDRIHTIQNAGLDVWCGMIVGFDNDDPSIFDAQHRFLTAARVTQSSLGMLHAIPKTPLHARLAREGRLDPSDTPECGTNVIPKKMTREQLRDGYVRVMNELVEPRSFFDRLDALYVKARIPYAPARAAFRRRHRWKQAVAGAFDLVRAAGLFASLMWHVGDANLRREYRSRAWQVILTRRDPGLLLYYLIKSAMHYHLHTMARSLAAGRLVSTFEVTPAESAQREVKAVANVV